MKNTLFIILAFLLCANAVAARGQENRVEEVIVICKTHFDLGYTHLIKDLIPYYRTQMIDQALDVMDASKELPPDQRFIWVSPGWVIKKVLEDWDGQTEARRTRLDEAVRSGRLVSHALPFSIQADALAPEGIARGFMFSDAFSRQYDLPLARGAKTTDVPCHTPGLATVLAHGGVQFMHIGCNWPAGYVHDLPLLFWWEGPDGSRVLCIYSSIYGTTSAFFPWGGTDDRGVGQNFIPPEGWPCKTWIAIIVTGDNQGPPDAEGLKARFEEAERMMPGVKVRMGTMEEFAEAILREIEEDGTELPVVRGETPDTWIHGYMSDPRGMKSLRRLGTALPAAEILNTQLRLAWGLSETPDPAEETAVAWENYLLYGEHTWGVAASPGEYGEAFYANVAAGAYAWIEGSWEDKTDYIRTAERIETEIREADMRALAEAVRREEDSVVVFNPLPWARSEWVEVAGRTVFAADVPASGYKLIPLTTAGNEAQRSDRIEPSSDSPLQSGHFASATFSAVVENEFYRIRLDAEKGGIMSFVDKRTGRDWADPDGEYRLGQYLNERFERSQTDGFVRDYQQGRWGETLHPGMIKNIPADVPYRAAVGRGGAVRVTKTAEKQTARIEFPGDAENHLTPSVLEVVLYKNSPYVDLTITIQDKPKDNWPEADWFCMPFKVAAPKFRVARPLGFMDPAKDILKGANRHYYSAGMGITITEPDGAGIALCPLDHEMVSLGVPGNWKFSLDYVPEKPVVFLNLYNNQYNTNFRYWYTGTWSSRVRLWTVADDSGESLNLPSLEARHPMVAAITEGPGGTLPAEQNGISVSRKGVIITCFGTDIPRGKTVLRLWEMIGESGACTVTFPEAMRVKSVQPINIRGEAAGEAVSVVNNQFTYTANGFGPASFLINP